MQETQSYQKSVPLDIFLTNWYSLIVLALENKTLMFLLF